MLGWLMLFFLVWALASLAWTDDAELTLRRLVAFVMLCVGAIAVVKFFSVRDVIWFVFFSTGLYVAVGLSAELALGTFQPLVSDYRFAGTFSWNMQGINCALLLLSAIFLKDDAKRGRKLFFAVGLLALAFLILTKSRTSLSCAILVILLYCGVVTPSSRKLVVVLCVGIAFCLGFLFAGGTLFPAFQEAMSANRDVGSASGSMLWLTGRVPLWQDCLTYIEKRPFLGYGYGGFWTPSRVDQISFLNDWTISVAHSAFIDFALSLGLIGMGAYVLILIMGIGRSFISYRSSANAGYAFIGVLLIFCISDGFTESAVVQPTLLEFLVIIALLQFGFQDPYTSVSQKS